MTPIPALYAASIIGLFLGAAMLKLDTPPSEVNKLPHRTGISANMGVKYQNHLPLVPCATDYECMVLNGGDGSLYEMDDYYDLCDRVMSCVPGTEMDIRTQSRMILLWTY